MKHTLLYLILGFAALGMKAQTRKQCIDDDWRFHYGALTSTPSTDDTKAWRNLDLPHDWSVETDAARALGGEVVGPFSNKAVGTTQTGWMVGGEGWYAKDFTLSQSQADKLITLYFEGVYNHAIIYVNGTRVYFNHYGYSSFRVDITPYLRPVGEVNNLLVQVRNEGSNTRWYAGSGIYRHVWMLTTPKLHLDDWGTIVKADKVEGGVAKVSVTTTLVNDDTKPKTGEVTINLTDKDGQTVGTTTIHTNIAAQEETQIKAEVDVDTPHLWDTEDPYLYRAQIVMNEGDDRLSIPFGIRTLEFTATEGFKLNGKNTYLKGGCVHHDNGLLGAAQWDKAEERKMRLLKEQGYNALRGSHNMQSENFLDLCDSLGMMFIDENFDQWYLLKNADDYHNYFPDYHDRDLQIMLKRDINHPSIIMWSIGNEIPGRIEPQGIEVAKEMNTIIKSYDDNRAVTAAICGWDAGDAWNSQNGNWAVQDDKAFLSLDVAGYNYLYNNYEHDHGTHPNRVICGLESFPKQSSQNWDLVEQKPYVIGDFVWTAMDYLGEAGIGSANWATSIPMFQSWPWFNGWCGDIDLIGQKKPQSYYHDVVWRRSPITMAVEQPHTSESISLWGWQQEHQRWTWPGYTSSDKMTVNVYSRAPKVRLYLNNKLVGEGTPGNTYWCGFQVNYASGTLRAVNVENGKETDSFELVTTGTAAKVRLTADRKSYTSDGKDLVYVTAELVDAQGRVITSNSTQQITFSVDGEGTLLASGTASPNDMASFRNTKVKLFEGRALAIIRTSKTAGDIHVSVTATNTKLNNTLTITTTADDTTDGITSPSAQTLTTPPFDKGGYADGHVYDMTGRVVLHPTKGIYIANGKKVFY